jgi:hypothetical protein
MSNFNATSNQNQNIYPKPWPIIAISRFIGILPQMNIGKYSPRRNIFVLIHTTNQQLLILLILQPLQQPNQIIIKNPLSQPKPKMSNSFELLQGSIAEVQKKYEILSDIVIIEYNDKVHGSQRDRAKDRSY